MTELIDPLAWSVVLMLAGCALIVLEVFIPSGGVLGFLAATSVIASIMLAFYHYGPATGFMFAATATVAVPLLIALGFKYWPNTPLGRRFLLAPPTDEEVLPDDPKRRMLKEMVGRTGIAKTKMLPSGAVMIDGRVIDAVSQGLPIEAGDLVKVIEVRANRVVVRALEPGEEFQTQRDADDLLSRPLDELGIDSLEDPLA